MAILADTTHHSRNDPENNVAEPSSSADGDSSTVLARRVLDLPLDRFIEHLTEAGCFKLLKWARREAPDLLRTLMTAFVTAESPVNPENARTRHNRLKIDAHLESQVNDPNLTSSRAKASSAPSLKEAERAYIQRVIKESRTLREAASKLGINTATLWRKRKLYEI
jgi:DNA-binding NtrC family response regulator